MGYIMNIDAGTGSVRAVIFDESANQIGLGQEEWMHYGENGVDGAMNFDTVAAWQTICNCIKTAISQANIKPVDISVVTATSMREGIVLYDKNGKEIWAVANVDSRATAEVAWLKNEFASLEEEFYKKSGQTFALGALPRILWLKNNRPSVYDKVKHLTMIDSWVLYKLTGIFACDVSNAGTTGIFDLQSRRWATDMASKLGLKDDIFPPIYESGTVLSTVTPSAAQECSLSEKTIVTVGGGDVQMGSLGVGAVNEKDCALLGGTFWQQTVNIKSSLIDPSMNLRINPHVVTGLSQAEGITFFAGMTMRWFRDTLALAQKQEAQKLGIDAYEHLENLAAKVPAGSYGVIPIFSDSMKYKTWIHTMPSFLNLPFDVQKMSIPLLFRALEENAAIVSAVNLEKIQQFSGYKLDKIIFAGGASKGKLWSQILADVAGLPIQIPLVKEATSLGAAFTAGVGVKIYSNLQEATDNLVKWERSFEPNIANKPVYDEAKKNWQTAYSKMLELLDLKVGTPMWKAPGL